MQNRQIENILSLSKPALKLFSYLASLTSIYGEFQTGTIVFKKNSSRDLQFVIGSLYKLVPWRLKL